MKISISREVLLPALQAVNNVVERRQTLAVLANVLVAADEHGVTLTATDMEVEIIVHLPVDVAKEGAVTIPARKLLDICRSLPSGAQIVIDAAEAKVKVQSGRSRFVLATLPASEFPSIGTFQANLEVEVDAAALTDLINSTQFAMAHQDVRYYLNGLLLEFSEQHIRAVATDGHRLALCDREVPMAAAPLRQVIVPRKGVMEIVRLLGHTDAKVALALGGNHLKVAIPSQSVSTKLVDGRFPDYERVIPRGGDKIVLAMREDTRAALSRTSILSNEKFRGVRLQLSPGVLKATAHNPEQEEAEEDVEVDYAGEELEIGFNVSYLLDALGVIGAEKVRLELSDPNSSCLLQAVDDPRARYVIMPMRL